MQSYERVEVFDLTRQQFGADFESGSGPVEYLWNYLAHLRASGCIRETNYVDRHFLADFVSYYARSFRPPPPHCVRLHYFDCDATRLNGFVDAFYTGSDPRAADALLSDHYLGFVVCRPLPGARIGRAVLRTYQGDTGRHYTAVRRYLVHLGTLRLAVEGLAYQQQDVGAAACAPTALWSALQKVAHVAGDRTPTPSAVSAAAESPYAASEGLTDPQMATSLVRLGYAADSFEPEDRALFRARLAACLRSGLPVVLQVGNSTSHAITCTGYREPEHVVEVPSRDDPSAKLIRMRSGTIRTIYVHDDNLGSHAHYELHDSLPAGFEHVAAELPVDPDAVLWLVRGRTGQAPETWWQPDCLAVLSALVPKPSKLRLPVERLIHLASALQPTAELIFDGLELHYDVAFSSGVEYRRSMLAAPLQAAARRNFDFQADLPRHLAVVSVSAQRTSLVDFLSDATTIDLEPGQDSLLGIVAPGVPVGSSPWKILAELADELEIPLIGGVPSPPSVH